MLDDVSHALTHPIETVERHPYSVIPSLLLLGLAVLGFMAILPELRRYMRLERM
jgi:hypothetical protein